MFPFHEILNSIQDSVKHLKCFLQKNEAPWNSCEVFDWVLNSTLIFKTGISSYFWKTNHTVGDNCFFCKTLHLRYLIGFLYTPLRGVFRTLSFCIWKSSLLSENLAKQHMWMTAFQDLVKHLRWSIWQKSLSACSR